jgi:succinoglycan biosynthesis protein ExoM
VISIQPKINVCVATFKRPELLKKLLLSLAAQETDGEFSFTIIVADNDAQRSAESVVHEFNAAGQKVIYAVEPEQNISLARNKSLSLAAGDYIATIDDDEYADPQWLLNLYLAMKSYNADVVHGPVISEFPSRTPNAIRECFIRPNPPTGSTENYILNTGNSLFRRELIEGLATPFDPRFGRTGSEDTVFFNRLKRRGSRMIWCREALVFEPVAPRKANLMWLLKRRFRNGNLYPRCHDHPDLITGVAIRFSCQELLKLSCAGLFYMVGGIFSPKYKNRGIKRVLYISYHLGILAHYGNFHVGSRDDEIPNT